ncbi:hypothetical protein CYLTODRAFT_493430 [Cylindrobasidium torrendii FP15055 ss-10]|uniref:Uncharacterized protein n=1 Tax=Cylindrobasidium torrendii FP15055 ss-10 TaxID=1314674 RepID=A0A0D7B0Q0_9AGAR|nr:hypothetical protein CYLTODRAFT_493430 [Cylindrobasidium torrendii FP15055 ss-10]
MASNNTLQAPVPQDDKTASNMAMSSTRGIRPSSVHTTSTTDSGSIHFAHAEPDSDIESIMPKIRLGYRFPDYRVTKNTTSSEDPARLNKLTRALSVKTTGQGDSSASPPRGRFPNLRQKSTTPKGGEDGETPVKDGNMLKNFLSRRRDSNKRSKEGIMSQAQAIAAEYRSGDHVEY